MAKTLVISGADFSNNAFDKVIFKRDGKIQFEYHVGYSFISIKNDYASVNKNAYCAVLGIEENRYHSLWSDADTKIIGMKLCPLIVDGTRVKIECGEFRSIVLFCDSKTECSEGNGAAKVVSNSGYYEYGDKEYIMPEGADSILVVIAGGNVGDINDKSIKTVKITAYD